MRKALEGLAGVEKVEMDLESDLFRVTGAATRESIFAAIRGLGYAPSSADAAAFRGTPEWTHPTGGTPDVVRQACDRARAEKKLVLIDCMGDS